MTTRDDIKSIVYFLKGAYPNYQPILDGNTTAIDVLYSLLADIDVDLLRLAVQQACAEPGRQFAPSAGEIREAVIQIQAQLNGVPDVAQAWGVIVKSLSVAPGDKNGWQNFKESNPLMDHPIVQEVVSLLGGWYSLKMSENPSVERAHFFRLFDEVKRREFTGRVQLPQVTGYIEEGRAQIAMGELTKRLEDGNHE